jgi:HEAT repeat protein
LQRHALLKHGRLRITPSGDSVIDSHEKKAVTCRRLKHPLIFHLVCLAAGCGLTTGAWADEPDDELVQMVVELVGDADKDVRALGYDQIRTLPPGERATLRFVAELPKLPPDGQIGLLSALADRGDPAAREAVLKLLEATSDDGVRNSAIEAIGALGTAADVPLLLEFVASGSPEEKSAARASLVKCSDDEAVKSMLTALERSPAPLRVELMKILTVRRAQEALPQLLQAARDADLEVRAAAMTSLGQLGGAEQIPGMVQGLLAASAGPERQAAERALLIVCNRVQSAGENAEPLLAAMSALNEAERREMLPTLGRTGGAEALRTIESTIADDDPKLHELGIRSLCNWPNATIAPRLIELAESDEHDAHRALALRALIRVAPLPDGRTDDERLELLQQVTAMCTTDEQRKLILQRAAAIRSIEALQFVVPYLEQPAFAQQACESVVELAHHRALREPNKAEFEEALDRVLTTSQDPTVLDRATRYKNGQTWNRPRPADAR